MKQTLANCEVLTFESESEGVGEMAKNSGNIYTIEMNDAQMDVYEAFLKQRREGTSELDALRQRVSELEVERDALKATLIVIHEFAGNRGAKTPSPFNHGHLNSIANIADKALRGEFTD